MSDFQSEKAVVRAFHEALSAATPANVEGILADHTLPDWQWRGLHPFHEQKGASAVAKAFWQPFLTAMKRVQRRPDIFFAGLNEIDDFQGVWVVQMGHLMALHDAPFLGIPPTGRIAMLRFAEFNRVENGKIVETAFFFDLIHLMQQAGLRPLPQQTGAHLVQPGPLTHDGLLYERHEKGAGEDTLRLINRMIGSISNQRSFNSPEEELALDWHDDMLWWGPDGIGATYTIDRYIQQHQRPFRQQTGTRQFNGHLARLAEGNYGGFFGWPNLTLHPTGGYMGLPANGMPADMRVVDIYRRSGEKLAENWIFIDILHFLNMQGLDVLGRIASLERRL